MSLWYVSPFLNFKPIIVDPINRHLKLIFVAEKPLGLDFLTSAYSRAIIKP